MDHVEKRLFRLLLLADAGAIFVSMVAGPLNRTALAMGCGLIPIFTHFIVCTPSAVYISILSAVKTFSVLLPATVRTVTSSAASPSSASRFAACTGITLTGTPPE